MWRVITIIAKGNYKERMGHLHAIKYIQVQDLQNLMKFVILVYLQFSIQVSIVLKSQRKII
ncbi:unnamed protein product [Paramecium pentaurelia]|uniref:Uncharacterized protein n=1 Tax=Paramecium pentaurelia TaxID=43138 RepID=A0A8S1SKF8_9CILI|nr:unnamed protein product [Paramecium pentaurelia]